MDCSTNFAKICVRMFKPRSLGIFPCYYQCHLIWFKLSFLLSQEMMDTGIATSVYGLQTQTCAVLELVFLTTKWSWLITLGWSPSSLSVVQPFYLIAFTLMLPCCKCLGFGCCSTGLPHRIASRHSGGHSINAHLFGLYMWTSQPTPTGKAGMSSLFVISSDPFPLPP